MRFPSQVLRIGFAMLLAVPRTARAQCPVGTATTGLADVEGDRAIVASIEAPLPSVTFYARGADGWHAAQTSTIGDSFVVLYPTVAMDGDRAIAGSPESQGTRGEAHVFDRIGERWIPTRLLPSGVEPLDFFGSSVDVSGDVAVVGASHTYAVDGGNGPGRIHVFEFDGRGWPQTAELPVYGDSIDVEGDTIAVGRQWSGVEGGVQVYRKIRGAWTKIVELRSPGGPGENETFGTSVALQGNRIAVGTPWSNASSQGAVHVFRETASGWVTEQEIRPRQGFDHDEFGTGLSWSGSVLLVGAPAGPVLRNGSVHRFDEIGGRFVETSVLHAGWRDASFGFQVAGSAGNAVVFADPDTVFFRLGIADATAFCLEPPNSTGSPGVLSLEGCDSLEGRSLTLHASDLPPYALARASLGGATPPVAFGDGYLCVGNPLFRLPGGGADAAGEYRSAFDFDSPAGRELAPGSTWSFQVLYRDPRSPSAGFNLTNAVSIGITP